MREIDKTFQKAKEDIAYIKGFYDGQLLELKRRLDHERNPEKATSWAMQTLLKMIN